VLRRAEPGARPGAPVVIEVGDLALDTGARSVYRAGVEVSLTGVEFDVLERLLRSAGNVVSREELSRSALDREYSAYDRSIDMHVSNLRRKLGPRPDDSERIKTVRGVGYAYVQPARRDEEAKPGTGSGED
ncbi:MAG: winged helix-turn-helix domain-containing protein, partial [Acidobacteriota bacterium]